MPLYVVVTLHLLWLSLYSLPPFLLPWTPLHLPLVLLLLLRMLLHPLLGVRRTSLTPPGIDQFSRNALGA
jgi:hypothetical protein